MKKFLFILFLLIFFSGCGSEFNNLDVKLNKQQINNNMIIIKGKVKTLKLQSPEADSYSPVFFDYQKNRYLNEILMEYRGSYPKDTILLIVDLNKSKLLLKKVDPFWSQKNIYKLNTYSFYDKNIAIHISTRLEKKVFYFDKTGFPKPLHVNPIILILKNINPSKGEIKNLEIEAKILKNHNEVFIENQILSSIKDFNTQDKINILANLINKNIINGESVQVRNLILKPFIKQYFSKSGELYEVGIKLMKKYPSFEKIVKNKVKLNNKNYIKEYSNINNFLVLIINYLNHYATLVETSPHKAKLFKAYIFKVLNKIRPNLNKNHIEYNSFDVISPLLESMSLNEKVEELKFELIKYLLDNDIIDPFFYYVVNTGWGMNDYRPVALMDKIYDYAKQLSHDLYFKYLGLVWKYRNDSPIIFFAKKNNYSMLEFLLNKKECNNPSYDTNYLKYFLYCKVYKENNDLDINEEDKKGKTALYYAIKNQNLKIVKLLLENGANPNQFDSLSLAAKLNNLDILKTLLNYKAKIKNSNALSIAFKNKNQKIINYLLNLPDLSLKQNDLNAAVKYGTFENVKTLLKQGLKPTEKTFEYALERGNEKIINYLYTHYEIPINTKILAIIVNKNMFPLYKNIIKNKPVSCDQIEKVAKLNNKKYISLMKKYKSKEIKECIKGLEYYLQDYTNPNFDSISRNNMKALRLLYSRYYNINVPQKVINIYNKYYQKYLAYVKRKAKEPKTYSIEDCYNGVGGARCCVVTINGEDKGSICYQWDSSYKHYTIFPVWGSKIYENGYYDPNLHMIWTTKCGYSSSGSVYSISDALNKFLNCVVNGHY